MTPAGHSKMVEVSWERLRELSCNRDVHNILHSFTYFFINSANFGGKREFNKMLFSLGKGNISSQSQECKSEFPKHLKYFQHN